MITAYIIYSFFAALFLFLELRKKDKKKYSLLASLFGFIFLMIFHPIKIIMKIIRAIYK